MKKWVRTKVASLFAKVSEEIGNTLAEPSELHVHDLRTSVRRTRESLAVFEQFFPAAEARKVRKSLQGLMHLAAEIRNRDVALDLLANSQGPAVRLQRSLEVERERSRGELVQALTHIRSSAAESDWNVKLRLVKAPRS